MDPKPKRDMDERTSIDGMEFEEVLEAMLTDPELPPVGEPFTESDDEAI